MRKTFRVFGMILGALVAGLTGPADAGLFTGTFEGVFSGPDLAGIVIDINGDPIFADTSATAVFSGIGTNVLKWGSGDFPPPNESTVIFTGYSIANAPGNTEIALGEFFFENGTSLVGTGIFGADLTIFLAGDASVVPLVSQMGILTTTNIADDPLRSADFLAFSTFPDTFHVFEGANATAVLFGRIVGDPEIELTRLELQSGGGFIGQGPVGVPEPSSWLMIVSGVTALALIRRRRV